MSEQITVGDTKIDRFDNCISLDDGIGYINIPLSDAPAIAAAISKLAGEPDAREVVERLIEAIAEIRAALSGPPHHLRAIQAIARLPDTPIPRLDAALTAARDWVAKQGAKK